MARIKKRVVDSLTPGPRDVIHWDDALHGFGVRVWPTGRKVCVAMTRVKGRLRKVTIGSHGTMTPDQARTRGARDHLLGPVDKYRPAIMAAARYQFAS